MADRGKRPMTPEEENPDTRANKKKTIVTPGDGRRIEAIPETFDPSYHGPPPASMHFSAEDSSFALHPLPATKQMFGSLQTSSSWSDSDPWLPLRWAVSPFYEGHDLISDRSITKIIDIRDATSSGSRHAHICKAEYRRYIDHCVYHMCRICYSNVYWSYGEFLCARCCLTEIPCEMCTVRIHIADLSGTIAVNLFLDDIAHLLEMNYSSFFEYLIKGVDVRKLFEHLEGQNMLLQVQLVKKKEGPSWIALKVLKIPKKEGHKCALDDGLNNILPKIAQNGNGRVYSEFYIQPTTLDMGDYLVYARHKDVGVGISSHDDLETSNGNAFRHGLHQVQFTHETNTSRSTQ